VEFNLPENWICGDATPQGKSVQYVCHCPVGEKGKEARVIVTATLFKGKPEQVLSRAHAKYGSEKAVAGQSPAKPEDVKIGEATWASSPLVESSSPGSYAHYLSTSVQNLQVEVAFVAKKDEFNAYLPIFDPAARSMHLLERTSGPCRGNYLDAADVMGKGHCGK
jgi:hypothetical protein